MNPGEIASAKFGALPAAEARNARCQGEQAPAPSTGALGSRPLSDTPLSIGQVSAERIAKIAAITIDQAFA
jgi:hypothetical protein